MELFSGERLLRFGFMGFGEAARSFVSSLHRRNAELRFRAWDIQLSDPKSSQPMLDALHSQQVQVLDGLHGFADCQMIFSAVTAAQCLVAAKSLAPFLREGQVLIDINSVTPAIKAQCARLVAASGASYLDMAVMAPVDPRGHATPVCVAGPMVYQIWPQLLATGFSGEIIGMEPGSATAIKMVRSMFVKGLEAITVETLLAAEVSGCLDMILKSLSDSYPGLGWPQVAAYHFDRLTQHGKRRSEEMMMSAETLDALGLNGGLAREVALVHARTHGLGPAEQEGSLQDLVSKVLAGRLRLHDPGADDLAGPDTSDI